MMIVLELVNQSPNDRQQFLSVLFYFIIITISFFQFKDPIGHHHFVSCFFFFFFFFELKLLLDNCVFLMIFNAFW